MEAIQQTYMPIILDRPAGQTFLHKFLAWCKSQEHNRLLWLAIIIVAHGCIITPITVLLITLSGNSMLMWAFAIAAMAMSLVVNLAAMPARITVPIFFFSLLIDLVIITTCITSLF